MRCKNWEGLAEEKERLLQEVICDFKQERRATKSAEERLKKECDQLRKRIFNLEERVKEPAVSDEKPLKQTDPKASKVDSRDEKIKTIQADLEEVLNLKRIAQDLIDEEESKDDRLEP